MTTNHNDDLFSSHPQCGGNDPKLDLEVFQKGEDKQQVMVDREERRKGKGEEDGCSLRKAVVYLNK